MKLAEQVSRDHQVPAVAVFWIDAEDHDWEEVRSCTVFDETLAPRTVSLPARPGAEPAPVATVRLDRSIVDTLDEIERILAATEFRSAIMERLRHAYTPGVGMADAFGAMARGRARPARAGGLRLVGSCGEAAGQPGVRARAVDAGPDGEARGAGRIRSHRARLSRASARAGRQPRAVSPQRRAPAPIRQQDGRFFVGDQQYPAAALVTAGNRASGGIQPERAAAADRAGHTVPDDLLRGRAERARVSRSAPRRLRPLRCADAADLPARDGDDARFGRAAFPHEVQAAARGAAGAGRSGAERAARRPRFRRSSTTRSPRRRRQSTRR